MCFLQIHLLRTFPYSNPNRDDAGRPKGGIMGGVPRLRISSQSQKRALRESVVFSSAVGMNEAARSRQLPNMIAKALLDRGCDPDLVEIAILDIVGQFMKLSDLEATRRSAKDKDMTRETWFETVKSKEQIFATNDEVARLIDFCAKTIAQTPPKKAKGSKDGESGAAHMTFGIKLAPAIEEVFAETSSSVDVAMFGRMLATIRPHADRNVDGALQVAHAMTTHKAVPEDDYFSSVDELNRHGASIIETQGFGSGTYYQYFCIDMDTLRENLDDPDLALPAAVALLEAAITVVPGAKIRSHAHRTMPFYIRCEVGPGFNRSLADAFTAPVEDPDIQRASIDRIEFLATQQMRAYAPPDLKVMTHNLFDPDTPTIRDILDFARKEAA